MRKVYAWNVKPIHLPAFLEALQENDFGIQVNCFFADGMTSVMAACLVNNAVLKRLEILSKGIQPPVECESAR